MICCIEGGIKRVAAFDDDEITRPEKKIKLDEGERPQHVEKEEVKPSPVANSTTPSLLSHSKPLVSTKNQSMVQAASKPAPFKNPMLPSKAKPPPDADEETCEKSYWTVLWCKYAPKKKHKTYSDGTILFYLLDTSME